MRIQVRREGWHIDIDGIPGGIAWICAVALVGLAIFVMVPELGMWIGMPDALR